MQCIVTHTTVCIHTSLQSVLSYKFLILDVYHLATPYVRDVGIRENKRGLQAKKFWETLH
jgi:hypothetical protein